MENRLRYNNKNNSMVPGICFCKNLLPDSIFVIRVLQPKRTDSSLKHGGYFCRRFSASLQHQSIKMDTSRPGTHSKHRAKKKAFVDIIKVKNESVSESKANVTRLTQHSIDKTLGILPLSSASLVRDTPSSHAALPPRVPLLSADHDPRLSENLGEEVSLQKFSKLVKTAQEKGLSTFSNLSEAVRWNNGEIHTFDDNSLMNVGLRSDSRSTFDNHWDINRVRELYENEIKGAVETSASDLSGLSSPLDGFAEVVDRVSENSSDFKKKMTPSKKVKKKVISTKAKTFSANEKEQVAEKKKSKKQKKKEVDKVLQELGTNPLKISSAKIDNAISEALDAGAGVESGAKKTAKNPKSAGKKISKKKLRQEEISGIRKMCRQVLFNQSLEAYLNVCVNIGIVNRALHTLLHYRNIGIKTPEQKITSIEPYNIVLEALAQKGKYTKMEELRYLLEIDKIPLDVRSYAAFLQCLGNFPSNKNNARIRNILDIMKNEGVELDRLFKDVILLGNGYATVLNAIRQVLPDFKPTEKKTDDFYKCNLVNSLNDSFHSTKVRPPLSGLISEKQLEEWFEEQFNREVLGEITIKSIEEKEVTPEVIRYRKQLVRWEKKWREALQSSFITKVDTMKRTFLSTRHKSINLYPYLVCLPTEDYINIMMQEINQLASATESYSSSRYNLHRGIAEKVYQRYLVNCKKEMGILTRLKEVYREYCHWMLSGNFGDDVPYMPRIEWNNLGTKDLGYLFPEWSNSTLLALGQVLYSVILQNVMVWKPLGTEKNTYPAFYEIDRPRDYKLTEEIKAAPILIDLYSRAARSTLSFSSNVAPMVSPPIPWMSPTFGGYLLNTNYILRLPFNAQLQKSRMKECGNDQLFPVMDSLNQLGSVPWRVNKPMLDLLIEVFNNKGWEEMDIPPPMSECPEPPKITSDMTAKDKKQVYYERLQLRKKKSEMFSLWCDALYKLSFANHFRDRIIWFPHNMDFRGRVYPLPTHINHMSSDVFRSILCFARGEKLGARGLYWLKLHLINLTGIVKREAIEDRLKYVETVMDDIMDSADKPLTGRKWWTKSDEPWQTLAACKELTAAIRSGNPEEYVSHLPIHQDGSCNGLQHYAALGRDVTGAASVNLAPSRVPQDVYSAVAELVEKERLKDVEEGKEIAQMLEGYVQRKVIKQTVMTTVYGVTRFGARLQIEKQLKDLNFPRMNIWAASQYLTKKTFHSLEQMYTSAKEIQDWLTDCARLISLTRSRNMEWVTPLGLPVVQHYTVPIADKCPMSAVGIVTNIDDIMKPNTMKQKNAFPPNFIHSLDSSHMMLTSIYSQKADITFVSVHDCFWTHASTVDIMNRLCREQFVALHSEPVLENLQKYMMKCFSYQYEEFNHDGSAKDTAKLKLNCTLSQELSKGEFDINEVLDSVYFFS